jgi:hypothetical protein
MSKLAKLIGFEPNSVLKKVILQAVKDEGKPIEEIADRYSLPPMFRPDENGLIEVDGQKKTIEDYQKIYPYKRIIIFERRSSHDKKQNG